MSEYTYNEGICSNCRFAFECRHSSEGVQFCQEYELGDPSQNFEKNRATPAGAFSPKIEPQNSPGRSSEKVMGLCSNCLHRETCGFPKPASGVWHCEEYE